MTDLLSIRRTFSGVSTEELHSILKDELRVTAERLLRIAAIVAELEERGEDLSDIRIGMLGIIRKIGCGQVIPELVVKFQGSSSLRKVVQLPLQDQQKLLKEEHVQLVCRHDGQVTHRNIDPTKLTAAEASQVFARDHIRTQAEQVKLLDHWIDEPIPDAELTGVSIDQRRHRILVSGKDVPLTRLDLLRLAHRLSK